MPRPKTKTMTQAFCTPKILTSQKIGLVALHALDGTVARARDAFAADTILAATYSERLPVTHTLDLMGTRVDANAVVVLVVEVVVVGKFAVLELLVQVDARVDTHGGVLPQRSQVHGRARRACWQCDCLWHK